MPDKIEGQFYHQQPGTGVDNYVDGSATKPGLNQLVDSLNSSFEYLKYFVGSTLDEPKKSMVSAGGTVTLSVEKDGTGDIRYRTAETTETLDCTPAAQIVLTPGTDPVPVINYVYIDHTTGLLAKSIVEFPATPHSKIGEYYVRSALFHETHGLLGKNHKNHVFTPGDNGHMEHLNESRRRQACVYLNGLLLTQTGSGTGIVNFALTSGQLCRVHCHDVSAIPSPAEFFISNHETTSDLVRTNLHSVTTYNDGLTNLNEYWVGVLFVAHLDATSALFLLKPSAGYNTLNDALTDPDKTAVWDIPAPYIGASVYVARVVVRRTIASTTVHDIDTDVRGYNPSSVAGGGLSGVPDHGSTHLSSDPIPLTAAGLLGASAAGPAAELTPAQANILLGGVVGSKVVNYHPTAAQTMTTTYAPIDGSTIEYTPKSASSVIKYSFNFAFNSTEADNDSMTHIVLQSNSTGSWVDVPFKKRNTWVTIADPEESRNISFAVPSWGLTTASLRLAGRAYDAGDQQIIHQIETWDGATSVQLVDAVCEIKEIYNP